MSPYAELASFRTQLDAYLAALADRGESSVRAAFEEFFSAHPAVVAVRWEQGIGLATLDFELMGGGTYEAFEARLTGTAPTGFDREGCDDFAALLAATVDVLTACFGYDVGVRATRDAIVTLDLAA